MNIMNKVTWKCMKQNKKRTIVTIIGVIICVAMITGVCTIAASFQETMIQNAIYQNGAYELHATISLDTYHQLKQDDKIKDIMRLTAIGSTENPIKDSYRNSINIYSLDVKHMDLIGAKLEEGKLPANKNEILVASSLLHNQAFQHQIGDTMTLPLGHIEYGEQGEINFIKEKEMTFTITGSILCPTWENSDTYVMATMFDSSFLAKDNPLSVMFNLKTDKNFYKQVEDLTAAYDLQELNANNSLLIYKGISDNSVLATLIGVGAFLGVIILIGGFSLIYNAFSISLSERSRYLGMLSSIGATKKQKQASVFFEAFLIGIIAIPTGLLSGILGIKITFYFMSPYFANVFDVESGLAFVVNRWCILIPMVFSVFVLVISAWVPSLKASKINAISAIRQNGDFKIRKRDIKTSSLTRKLFGFEAELGLKNTKRYHARYLATLFSLIICIVLFMTASYFTTSMQQSVTMTSFASNYDLRVDFYTKNDKSIEELPELKELQQVKHAKSHTFFTEDSFQLEHVSLSDEAKAYIKIQSQGYDGLSEEDIKNMYYPRLYIQVLDDESFARYCEQIGVDVSEMKQKEPSFIFVNERNMYNDSDGSYREMKILKNVGNDITIIADSETNKKHSLHIVKQTDKVPDINPGYSSKLEVHAITNFANARLLNEELVAKGCPKISTFYEIQYQSDDAEALGKEVKAIVDGSDEITASFDNITEQRMREQQRTILISVFLYGFVVLILLICMTNIMNTISTSISLRKRELAMLKSIGITPSKFKKMIMYETLFYGIKAVVYGVPLGILCMFIMNLIYGQSLSFAFHVSWRNILFIILGVFFMLMIAMWYAIAKIRKDNIVETIRNESI